MWKLKNNFKLILPIERSNSGKGAEKKEKQVNICFHCSKVLILQLVSKTAPGHRLILPVYKVNLFNAKSLFLSVKGRQKTSKIFRDK